MDNNKKEKFPGEIAKVENLEFHVDTVGLLNEIADCAMSRNNGALRVPLNILKNLLAETAKEAIRIDDGRLHLCMVRLGLYEIEPAKIPSVIKELEAKIMKTEHIPHATGGWRGQHYRLSDTGDNCNCNSCSHSELSMELECYCRIKQKNVDYFYICDLYEEKK